MRLAALYRQIVRKKTIDELLNGTRDGPTLHRVLGPLELILLGVGAIIGTGIFVITGIAAANYTGPALILSFLVSGIVCVFAALAYAEFASLVPVAGSAYTYSYASLGEIWAWIIGWDLILEYSVSVAAVAIGWSGYMVNLLQSGGVGLPSALVHPPGTAGGIINFPAIFIILAVSALLILGVQQSARVNTVIVLVKLSVIGLFLFLGLSHVSFGNWIPFMPFGWTGVLTGAAIVFFAYIGFDAVSTAAEEVREPQINLPKGIIISLLICTVLYILVSAVLTGIVPYYALRDTSAPVAFALVSIGISWGGALVSVGAICGITSVIIVLLYSQARIFFAMARDGLLPRFFGRVHPVFRTPAAVTFLIGVLTAALAGSLPLQSVTELVNIGTLAAFIIVSAGVIVLRRSHPGIPRPFRCPYVPLIPALCIVSCSALVLALPAVTHLRFVVWLVIGLGIYMMYGRKSCRRVKDTSCGHESAPED